MKTRFHFQTRHFQGEAWLEFGTYPNDRLAITLQDREGVIMKITLNLPEVKLKPNQIIIKDYSENSGIYLALARLGLITTTELTIPLSPFAEARIAETTPLLMELFEEQVVNS